MSHLAPCPVCGSKAEVRPSEKVGGLKGMVYVVCEYNCVRLVGDFGTEAAAAAVWNRRKLPEAICAVLEDAQRRVRLLNSPTSTRGVKE